MTTLFRLYIPIATAVFLAAVLLFHIHRTPDFDNVRAAYKSSDHVILDRNNQILDEVRVGQTGRRLAWVGLSDVPATFVEALLESEGLFAITLDVAYLVKSSAPALVIKWPRSAILEAYINLVYYRGELQGLSAAAHSLFDKPPKNLTRAEATVMAVMVRTPNVPIDKLHRRVCQVLAALGTPEDCGLLSTEHLSYIEKSYHLRPYARMAPHLAQRLASRKDQQGGMLRSTLDRKIQWVAIHALQKRSLEGAVIVIENTTGNVLAYTGGFAVKDEAQTARPMGGTLKPFIFAIAIEEKILTAATLLEDSPLAMSHRRRKYFRAPVTTRVALASGLNIPAVHALELVGVESFAHMLQDLDFTTLARAETYGPSLALGSADLRLSEMSNAYRTLANGGVWTPLRFSPDEASDQAAKRIVSKEAAFIIKDILSDHKGRVEVLGFDNLIGFSPSYTVAVWSPESESVTAVWREVMDYVERQKLRDSPLPPMSLVRSADEWFLSGTEPASVNRTELRGGLSSRISYPAHEAVIALDAGASKPAGKVFIQIIAPQSDQNVYLNDERIGKAQSLIPWTPVAGHFVLELRNSKGVVLDKVSFEVRGRGFAVVGG